MSKFKRGLAYLILVGIVGLIGVPAAVFVTFELWPDHMRKHFPLHSTMEAVGALAAILMALILLMRKPEEDGRNVLMPAVGFLGMGVLDGFHAVSIPGDGFVLLHTLASVVGGFFFALVWLPGSGRLVAGKKWLAGMVAAGAVLLGIWTLLFRETMPVMLENGRFTPAAVGLNFGAGVFFIAAAGRFLLDFHRFGAAQDYLFCCMALLFGVAEVTFKYSAPWDDAWWFWHVLRLAAYIIVLGFVVWTFYREMAERQRREEELRRSNRELEAEIAERKRAHEIISAQARAILELSTPVVEIREGVLILPLIGTIDTQRAQQIMENLLGRIVETSATTVLLDLTGVPVVDTEVANHLIRTAQAARLLGARPVLTGIRPEIAQTLVHLGVDLGAIETCGSLKDWLSPQRHQDTKKYP